MILKEAEVLTDEGFAAMLLTMALSPNREEYARPLSTQEYYRLAERVRDSKYRTPGGLIGADISGMMMYIGISEEEAYRIYTLLNRAVQFSYALEEFAEHRTEIVPICDESYPERLRRRLPQAAPPFLYRAGNARLIGAPAVAILGISGVKTTPEVREGVISLVKNAVRANYAVITGGELGAMVLVDCVARLVPGVLGCEESAQTESFSSGLLEYPQYTRPDVWEGREVPPILRSGVDREIARWRRKKMLERTMDKRPELFAKFVPQTDEDKALLDEIDAERHPRPVPPKIDCRRAEEADLPAILAIADEAKAFLAAQGLDQWQHGYPAEEDFRRDIERGDGWLFTADGNPAGYLCISRRSEAAYTAIEGEWLSCAGPYLTIHRIMVSDAYRGKGIASEMISLADDFAHAYCCAGVRIDTAPGNEPMRAMLRKNGFETCGTIRLVGGVDDGALRIALEKLVER